MKKRNYLKSAIIIATLLLSCCTAVFSQQENTDTTWYKGWSEGFLFHDYFMIQFKDDWAIVNQFSEMDHRMSQKSMIGAEVLTTEYIYDALGRTRMIKYPSNTKILLEYNALDGSLDGIQKLNTSGLPEVHLYATYEKNALGQVT